MQQTEAVNKLDVCILHQLAAVQHLYQHDTFVNPHAQNSTFNYH